MKKGNEMGDLRIAMSSSASKSDLLAGSSFGQRSEMKGWFTMKKLMFAAAVAAGVMANCYSIESQVVGYGQADLNERYTGVGPMFFSIGEDATSVQNLKVKGVDQAEGSGYTIAPITSTGNIPVKFFWWGGHVEDGLPDGWYITDDSEIIEAAIEAGTTADLLAPINMAKAEGLITYMQDANLDIQGSGEVLMADYTRPLNERYTGIANPFAVNANVQKYSVLGVDQAEGSGYTIAPITSTGNIPVKYFWWGGHLEDGLPDGWYITDDSEIIEAAIEAGKTADYLSDYTFKPGEAAITYMQDSGLSLKITNPIQ